ncbi:U3 snoRNP protein [Coemansia sp. RSA 989]|nr:U3 small nucleolar RNA-associated protein 6-domain-containing protein [Coemansia mojavensis]KAJ1741197.1 U3 snoRNP protein [Coemansia sp. RSA 1086]KAJ1863489.1 U3 snoRNP protein [Coemansia sp. RSA 989]KAJ1871388.1 U3 snoRNP protein [Coemansia sp. RSA 990]
MAEIVQYRLEQMVGELEDLERRGLFTKNELKAIVKKRTKFEYALRRRRACRADFLRYVEYETNVDALRRQRKQRLEQKGGKTSLSDFSITQRIISIFERAVVRHSEDVMLWIQFIEFIKSRRRLSSGDKDDEDDGHTRLLGRVFARAISAHPYEAQLWIKAAAHELEINMNGNAARILLQRALRLIPDNQQVWIEYFRLEMLLVEKIKARRRVLGIDRGDVADEKAAEGESGFIDVPQLDAEESAEGGDSVVEKLTEQALAQLDRKQAAQLDLSEEKRAVMSQHTNAYLQGAVAQVVYEQAIRSISGDLEFRQEFLSILKQFSDTDKLRDLVLASIRRDFAADAHAQAFLCTEHLSSVSIESPDVVDALKQAVENFQNTLNELDSPKMWTEYVAFLVQWLDTCKDVDSLRLFFVALLTRAIAAIGEQRDIRLDAQLAVDCAHAMQKLDSFDTMSLLNWLADSTQRFPNSAELWLCRMEMLVSLSDDQAMGSVASTSRTTTLFENQALIQAPQSRSLWDLWFDWTEKCFSSQLITADQVQSRFMAALMRVMQQRTQAATSDGGSKQLAQLQSLVAHLQIRYVDWAWKLPAAHKALSPFGEIAHMKFNPDDENDDEEVVQEQTEGNVAAMRQACQNISRHAFPTLAFYRRCIELEPEAKNKVTLYEMACRVDESDAEAWLDYLRFLIDTRHLGQASVVFWRATKLVSEDRQAEFEAAYQNMLAK